MAKAQKWQIVRTGGKIIQEPTTKAKCEKLMKEIIDSTGNQAVRKDEPGDITIFVVGWYTYRMERVE